MTDFFLFFFSDTYMSSQGLFYFTPRSFPPYITTCHEQVGLVILCFHISYKVLILTEKMKMLINDFQQCFKCVNMLVLIIHSQCLTGFVVISES